MLTATLLGHARDRDPLDTPRSPAPPLMLWAWERPTDLRWIDLEQVGVAFLALSLQLTGDEVQIRRRAQPLRMPAHTFRLAVTRIQTDNAGFSDLQLEKTLAALTDLASLDGVRGLQIDFDATVSQRPFYRRLLQSLRERLPQQIGLSMTALASWCQGDLWLEGLPVDEAVPMLFRMGVDQPNILRHLQTSGDFREPLCRSSTGISLDTPQPIPWIPRGRRLYLFHSESWKEEALLPFLSEVRR